MMLVSELLDRWSGAARLRGFRCDLLFERDGLPIYGCSKGDNSLPTIYLSSGVHGDEPAGPQALLNLLEDEFFDDRYHWLICPVLNPGGLQKETRENPDGIDLNRDYLNCQSPEVCAHIRWLKEQEGADLMLSLHEDWESIGVYYYEINRAVEAPSCDTILEAAAPFFQPEPCEIIDDHEVTKVGWIFHAGDPDIPDGWPEAIYFAKNGCPLSLTFETPSSGDFAARVACHEAMVRAAVMQCRGL